ncbi:hypothetical protein BG004_006413 [Podila humilis]|nr:hypothetical protein BG004_006413 [Podila humilis]
MNWEAALDIPHIRDAVASFLDDRDLTALVQVNRAFHDFFVPFIWSSVTITSEGTFGQNATVARHSHSHSLQGPCSHKPSYRSLCLTDTSEIKLCYVSFGIRAIRRYRHHVKRLATSLDLNTLSTIVATIYRYQPPIEIGTLFPNLRFLRTDRTRCQMDDIALFTRQHTNLNTVDIILYPLSSIGLWAEIFERTKRIHHVRIASGCDWRMQNVQQLLSACTRMLTLGLQLREPGVHSREMEVETVCKSREVQETIRAMDLFQETRWQKLMVYLNCPVLEHIFVGAMIAKSPQLNTLTLQLSGSEQILPPRLKSILAAAYSKELRHLDLKIKNDDLKFGSILGSSGVPQDLHHHRLESVDISLSRGTEAPGFLQTEFLHSRTLTRLSTSWFLFPQELSNIVCHCHQLKSLTVSVAWPSFEYWTAYNQQQLERSEWKMPLLEELEFLIYYDGNSTSTHRDFTPAMDAFVNHFMVQIGRQTKLKYLMIAPTEYSISLGHGLDRLGGLKGLKEASVFNRETVLRGPEAQFIVDHWDSIITVGYVEITQEAREILLEWRPWLQLQEDFL